MVIIPSASAQITRRLGAAIGARAEPGDAILLEGGLGAGKTTLVQGIAEGLGIAHAATSPTFTLIHELRGGRLPLYHVDLYRIETEDQLFDLGIADLFDGDGLLAVEWADRLGSLLPPAYLRIVIQWADEEQRLLRVEARGERAEELLRAAEALSTC